MPTSTKKEPKDKTTSKRKRLDNTTSNKRNRVDENLTIGTPTYFPAWFLAMTDSPPLLVVFAIAVLLFAPFLMVFGALYPLFKH